jgi:hypothetical protein
VPNVADPPVKEEMIPVTPRRTVAKKLEEVAFMLVRVVIVPLVAKRLVIVPAVVLEVLRTVWPETVRAVAEALPTTVWPLTVNAVAEAVVRVDCPVTLKVPLEVKEEVAVREPNVADPPVKVVMSEVTEVTKLENSEVDVAFVVMISVKVFTPANDWEVVETRPRAVRDAVGRLKEWIDVVEEMVKSVPDAVVSKV